MTFMGRKIRFFNRSPLTIVEAIISISSIVGGIYVLTPAIELHTPAAGASPLLAILGSDLGLIILGLWFLASGSVMLYGILKRHYKFRATGLFLNIMGRLYVVFGTWLVQGFLPLSWLANFTIALIGIVCYLVVRGMIIRGVRDD